VSSIHYIPGTGGTGNNPIYTEIFLGYRTAGQNVNGGAAPQTVNINWDASTNDSSEITSFVDGTAKLKIAKNGFIQVRAWTYISDSVMNDRQVFYPRILHSDRESTLKFRHMGSNMYARDDSATYDSVVGLAQNDFLKVESGDEITIEFQKVDGIDTTSQTLNGESYLMINKIEF
jgi:hypothetical protein